MPCRVCLSSLDLEATRLFWLAARDNIQAHEPPTWPNCLLKVTCCAAESKSIVSTVARFVTWSSFTPLNLRAGGVRVRVGCGCEKGKGYGEGRAASLP